MTPQPPLSPAVAQCGALLQTVARVATAFGQGVDHFLIVAL